MIHFEFLMLGFFEFFFFSMTKGKIIQKSGKFRFFSVWRVIRSSRFPLRFPSLFIFTSWLANATGLLLCLDRLFILLLVNPGLKRQIQTMVIMKIKLTNNMLYDCNSNTKYLHSSGTALALAKTNSRCICNTFTDLTVCWGSFLSYKSGEHICKLLLNNCA